MTNRADMARTRVHFFVPDPAVASAIGTWNPDKEPARFASGAGHNLLELAVRVKARRPDGVSWGPGIPSQSVVVVYAGDICDFRLRDYWLTIRLCLKPSSTFVLIRSDLRLSWQSALIPDLQFVPTRGLAARLPNAAWVPPLPQRGLVPRDIARGERVRVVAIKSNPENVPEICSTAEWAATLERLDLEWLRDCPRETDGSDQHWHDFRNVDVVVSLRPGSARTDMPKPPTRLINAWRAGVIPITHNDDAVREIGTDGEDVLVVRNEHGLLQAIERIASDTPLRVALFRASRRRGADFEPAQIVEEWIAAMEGARVTRRSLADTLRRFARGLRLLVELAWVAGYQPSHVRSRVNAFAPDKIG